MSEQRCNADTTGDTPCQNPTTDAGDPERCWIPSHNDPGAENPHGRDFVIDESDHDAIIDAAERGASKAGCARAAGTGIDQLTRYLEAHENFREAFARARAQGEQALLRDGAYGEADPSMAKFILATSFDYVKTEKREVTGDDGGSVELSITRTVVGDDGD